MASWPDAGVSLSSESELMEPDPSRGPAAPASPRERVLRGATEAQVYLVRHGQTPSNAAGLLRGHDDLPLDPLGLAQAAQLGRIFAEVPVELAAIFSSPLQRALDTARPIAAATGASVIVEPRLIDRDYGPWTGKSVQAFLAHLGGRDSAPGVESVAAMRLRAIAALTEAVARFPGGAIAVVAHDVVNRAILTQLVPDLADAELGQRVGCWNLLCRVQGRWTAPIVDAVPEDRRLPHPPG